MSLEFYGISYVAECDFCAETFDTDKDHDEGFQAAVQAMKREGWKIYKEDQDWRHKCPCCQEGNADGFDNLDEEE
jgi:N-acyl-L-homoserine lactone synthetase